MELNGLSSLPASAPHRSCRQTAVVTPAASAPPHGVSHDGCFSRSVFFGPAFLVFAKKGRAKKRGTLGEKMFEAKEMAKQIVIEIRPMLEEIKKRDVDLWDQAYRAAKSMALNV